MCGDSVWFGYNTLKSTGVNDDSNATNYYTGNANERLDASTVIAVPTTSNPSNKLASDGKNHIYLTFQFDSQNY